MRSTVGIPCLQAGEDVKFASITPTSEFQRKMVAAISSMFVGP
jgi:hypothetical protein